MHQFSNEQSRLLLTEAKKLLVDKGWVQGAYAVSETGRSIEAYEDIKAETSTCFCTLGAAIAAARQIGWISDNFTERDALLIEKAISDALDIRNVAEWNDHHLRTEGQILAKFDETIGRLAA